MNAVVGAVIAASAQLLELAAIPAAIAPYFSLPTCFLSGTASAGGIAALNTVGSLGGFVGPFVIGILRGRSGSYASGSATLEVELVVAAVMVLALAQVTERRAVMRSAKA